MTARIRSLVIASLVILVAAGSAPALAGPFDDPGHWAGEMVAWATAVESFDAGPVDVARPELGPATNGLPEWVLGPADELDPYGVVSLGDGGSITLSFASGIGEAPGDDFAVFENAFFYPGGFYGEFAFVEVSSNGLDFVRFPSTSLQATPVSGDFPIEPVDPTDYHNLAGDQPLGLGTGFDLADLRDDPRVRDGTLDLTDVRFVRLVDVVGDGSTHDASGLPLYDPYPTPFAAGGFDAEAVGVIHDVPEPGLASGLASGLALLATMARGRRRDGRAWRAGC